MRPPAHLRVEAASAGYGGAPIIRDISLQVARGEIVGIVGPNGAGKSTLMKSITGVINPSVGRIRIGEEDVTDASADAIARRGLGYVPQVRHIFPSLTVEENLEIGGYTLPPRQVRERIEAVVDVFPALADKRRRRAGDLSGGEAKMVAMGRVLMTSPSVVVLDEPTANLSPLMAGQLLREQVPALAREGAAVLVVEQRALEMLEIADWAYVLRDGEIVLSQAAAEMRARDDIGQLYLGRNAA
ncbi:MAG TPA: ABC transporter ATP-binding protein [Gemmatimonadaceae bacterium]|nr:ABC transporter ATP-binding protein [Gemmatimonadaceae bacterium]